MATLQATIESIDSISGLQTVRRRSIASSIVWLAIASDSGSLWRDGKLIPDDGLWADEPYCAVYGQAFAGSELSSWVREAISALDREIPSVHIVGNSLSARDFVAPLNPAVSRIPEVAEEYSAAVCIFAARLLISCQHLIIPPVFVSAETALSNLSDASYLAAAVGGPGAIREAIRIASRPQTYEIAIESEDMVEFGEVQR